jgi:hypothetical protein
MMVHTAEVRGGRLRQTVHSKTQKPKPRVECLTLDLYESKRDVHAPEATDLRGRQKVLGKKTRARGRPMSRKTSNWTKTGITTMKLDAMLLLSFAFSLCAIGWRKVSPTRRPARSAR